MAFHTRQHRPKTVEFKYKIEAQPTALSMMNWSKEDSDASRAALEEKITQGAQAPNFGAEHLDSVRL